jgi:addiction module RelE/StbE family toxin
MKKIEYTKVFKKHLQQRLSHQPKALKQLETRIDLFQRNERSELLNDHALTGSMTGLRAFSVSGDIRVIYQENDDACLFADIGTHNQVYK